MRGVWDISCVRGGAEDGAETVQTGAEEMYNGGRGREGETGWTWVGRKGSLAHSGRPSLRPFLPFSKARHRDGRARVQVAWRQAGDKPTEKKGARPHRSRGKEIDAARVRNGRFVPGVCPLGVCVCVRAGDRDRCPVWGPARRLPRHHEATRGRSEHSAAFASPFFCTSFSFFCSS